MISACVFDAYGTLLDLGSLRRAATARLPADAADSLVGRWRTKQLEYAWTWTLMGRWASFEELADRALDWAMASLHVEDPEMRITLVEAYRRLDAHSDAEVCLRAVRGLGIRSAVLSNGSRPAVEQVLEGAGLAPLIDTVISVDRVGAFKPDPRVYRHAARELRVDPSDVAFQSANPWDAAGAAAAGMRAYWVNRALGPDEYDLRRAATEIATLDELVPLLRRIG